MKTKSYFLLKLTGVTTVMVGTLVLLIFLGIFGIQSCAQQSRFEKLRNVCADTNDDNLEHAAAVEMSKIAESFDNWHWVNLCAINQSDLQITAAQHMADLSIKSKDIRDMATAAESANWTYQIELRAEIVKAMVVVANKNNKFDDWLQVSLITKYTDTHTYSIALNKMKKTATTANNWVWVYERAPKDSELREIALQKLDKLTPSFNNWRNIAVKSKYNDNVTFNMALDKMSQTANSYYDWEYVYQLAPPDSELQKFALKKMIK